MENFAKKEINNKFKKESSIKQEDFIEDSYQEVNISNKDDISERVIDDANKYFLIKILSPEITENESKKREHKDALISLVQNFLLFQFLIILALLFGVIVMIFVFHGVGNDLDLKYIKIIVNFASLYITSVVVELIAMLKYIVKNVFDTSITGLVEFYKENKKQEKDID